MGKLCAAAQRDGESVSDTEAFWWFKSLTELKFKLRPRTADDVALVVLLPLSYVQQQVGAVGVGPVSCQGAHRRLFFQLLVVGVQV